MEKEKQETNNEVLSSLFFFIVLIALGVAVYFISSQVQGLNRDVEAQIQSKEALVDMQIEAIQNGKADLVKKVK